MVYHLDWEQWLVALSRHVFVAKFKCRAETHAVEAL